MIDFFSKSTFSLIVFLMFYLLVLEKEKIHYFNRFFLVFSIIFSLILPFVSFEVIREIPKSLIEIGNIQVDIINQKTENNYLEIAVWLIYSIITLVLFIRFNRNVLRFYQKIKTNEIQNYQNTKLVLLDEKTLPYTFLNYIFINKNDFYSHSIEQELFTHELTHVNQKHTIDILFIELLKVIFWFNPIYIFYKKAIQLNHEFLADENVNSSHNNISFYQNLLLTKTYDTNYLLASNLNYQLTKKRLIMMSKNTSKTIEFIKKISVFPIIIGLLFLFCIKTVAQISKPIIKTKPKVTVVKKTNKKVITKVFYKDLKPDTSKIVTVVPFEAENLQDDTIYISNGLSNNNQPEFVGGMNAFYKFVGQNFKVPDVPNLKGTIYISFVVEKNGSLTDVKCLRDIGFETGKEAIRVINASPKWKPGILDGKPVRCTYQLPISVSNE